MIFRNIVTFRVDRPSGAVRLVMQLPQAWTRTLGVTADYNSAVVTAAELEKLGGAFDDMGAVEFWFTRPPPDVQGVDEGAAAVATADVVLREIKIVDIKPRLARSSSGEQLLEYILVLADKRDAWQPPRGGLLMRGLVNPSTSNTPDGSRGVTYLTSALVRMCLAAMGEPAPTIDGIDDTPPPVNLRWERAWAVEELKRLLDRANASVAIAADGSVKVVRLGRGEVPMTAAERTMPELKLVGISRRGSAVLVCSAPSATRLTINCPTAARGIAWRYVVPRVGDDGRQVEGEFRELTETDDVIRGISPSESDPKQRSLIDSAFRFVEITFAKSPPVEEVTTAVAEGSAVLPWLYEDQGLITPPLAVGQIPVNIGGGKIGIFETPQRIAAARLHVSAGRYVLEFDQRIIRLLPGVTECLAADWQQHFRRLAAVTPVDGADGYFRLTVEPVYVIDGTPEKQFFVEGYELRAVGDESLSRIDESAAAELLRSSTDRTLICRPELQRQILVPETGAGDEVDNLPELQSAAEAVAAAFLPATAGGDAPRVIVVVGFEPVELSGRVMSIDIDQAAVTTTMEIDTYHASRPFLAGQVDALKDSGRRATPAEARDNTGAAERPTVSMIGSPRAAEAGGGGTGCELIKITSIVPGQPGYYIGLRRTNISSAAPDGALVESHLGEFDPADPINPVLVRNLSECGNGQTQHELDPETLPRIYLGQVAPGEQVPSSLNAEAVFDLFGLQFQC